MANDTLTAPEEATENGTASEIAAEALPEPADESPVVDDIAENPEAEQPDAVVPHVASASSNLSDALAQAPSGVDESTPRKDVPDGRAYEIVYIVQAGDSDAAEATTARVRTLIDNADGAVDNVRTSETRRLAYPIDKQSEGVYVVVNARFNKSLTLEMDRFFRLEESVLRHMVIREEE